jgi:hypothetical protein
MAVDDGSMPCCRPNCWQCRFLPDATTLGGAKIDARLRSEASHMTVRQFQSRRVVTLVVLVALLVLFLLPFRP